MNIPVSIWSLFAVLGLADIKKNYITIIVQEIMTIFDNIAIHAIKTKVTVSIFQYELGNFSIVYNIHLISAPEGKYVVFPRVWTLTVTRWVGEHWDSRENKRNDFPWQYREILHFVKHSNRSCYMKIRNDLHCIISR